MPSWMRAPGRGGRLDSLAAIGLVAYHGSPHRFERFALHKIGTGEGAQAYGWGIYFASRKEVAEFYRQKLGGADKHRQVLVDGVPEKEFFQYRVTLPDVDAVLALHHIIYYVRLYTDPVRGLEEARKVARQIAEAGRGSKESLEAHKLFRAHKVTVEPDEMACCLYTVDIPEDDELLDYDRPLEEQPPGVIKKLSDAGILPDGEEVVGWFRDYLQRKDRSDPEWDRLVARITQFHKDGGKLPNGERYGGGLKGRVVYAALGNAVEASKRLLAAGIPGLRYLDGSSRGTGSGSYNYVIWDEGRISVTGRQGGPG